MSGPDWVDLTLGIAAILGTLGGTLLGSRLERRTIREQEQRLWAVEFRKRLSVFLQLLVDFRQGVERAAIAGTEYERRDLLAQSWALFHHDWDQVRGDAVAYLGLVPSVGLNLRTSLLDRSSLLENAVAAADTTRVRDAIQKVTDVVDRIIGSVDLLLGLKADTR